MPILRWAYMVPAVTFRAMPRRRRAGEAPPTADNMPGWKLISEAITDLVKTSGLPVEVIAERSGLSRQWVYLMMSGKCNPGMDKIEKVMAATGTTLHEWILDKSLYGRDKRLHDQLQGILNHKGAKAVAARETIDALTAINSKISS